MSLGAKRTRLDLPNYVRRSGDPANGGSIDLPAKQKTRVNIQIPLKVSGISLIQTMHRACRGAVNNNTRNSRQIFLTAKKFRCSLRSVANSPRFAELCEAKRGSRQRRVNRLIDKSRLKAAGQISFKSCTELVEVQNKITSPTEQHVAVSRSEARIPIGVSRIGKSTRPAKKTAG